MNFRWVRSQDSALFGVCKGIAKATQTPVGLVRAVWLVCVLFGGIGIGAYILLAISLPREDQVYQSMQPRFLGVCARLAKRMDVEPGVVRFFSICLLFASLGLTAVLYVIGYFVFENQPEAVASRSNPSNPPSTM